MSSTDQTHKEYLAHQNGSVYWPITAWDAVLGVPDDLAYKPDIDNAIKDVVKYPSLTDLSSNLIPATSDWILSNVTILENRISQTRGYLEIHFSAKCAITQPATQYFDVARLSGISGKISGVDDIPDAYGTASVWKYTGNAFLSSHGNGNLVIACVFTDDIGAGNGRGFNMRIPLSY